MAQCMRHAPLDIFAPSCLDMHGEYILTSVCGLMGDGIPKLLLSIVAITDPLTGNSATHAPPWQLPQFWRDHTSRIRMYPPSKNFFRPEYP
jgi:hypothetical protein